MQGHIRWLSSLPLSPGTKTVLSESSSPLNCASISYLSRRHALLQDLQWLSNQFTDSISTQKLQLQCAQSKNETFGQSNLLVTKCSDEQDFQENYHPTSINFHLHITCFATFHKALLNLLPHFALVDANKSAPFSKKASEHYFSVVGNFKNSVYFTYYCNSIC